MWVCSRLRLIGRLRCNYTATSFITFPHRLVSGRVTQCRWPAALGLRCSGQQGHGKTNRPWTTYAHTTLCGRSCNTRQAKARIDLICALGPIFSLAATYVDGEFYDHPACVCVCVVRLLRSDRHRRSHTQQHINFERESAFALSVIGCGYLQKHQSSVRRAASSIGSFGQELAVADDGGVILCGY